MHQGSTTQSWACKKKLDGNKQEALELRKSMQLNDRLLNNLLLNQNQSLPRWTHV